MPELASRIVGEGTEAPEQLLANPRNWRIHPRGQQDAVSKALDEVGWVKRVIVNKTTGCVVDGHLRVGLAISREEEAVPVTYVELSEDEERAVLATFDPLAGLAEADDEKFAELLDGVEDTSQLPDLEDVAPVPHVMKPPVERADSVLAICPGCGHEWDHDLG